jgi:gamma-glutamyltranspeptidase
MLNLLDGVDLARLGHNSPAYLHRLIEMVKLAFADRDAFYGDPKFVKVPAERLSPRPTPRPPGAHRRAGLAGDASGR